jgi:hypothetical protein
MKVHADIKGDTDAVEEIAFLGASEEGKARRRKLKFKRTGGFFVQYDLFTVCLYAGLVILLIGASDLLELVDMPQEDECQEGISSEESRRGLLMDTSHQDDLEHKCKLLVEGYPWPIILFFFLSVSGGFLLQMVTLLENGLLGLCSCVMLASGVMAYLAQVIITSLVSPGRQLWIWNAFVEAETALKLERGKCSVFFILISIVYTYVGYVGWRAYRIVKTERTIYESICDVFARYRQLVVNEPHEGDHGSIRRQECVHR